MKALTITFALLITIRSSKSDAFNYSLIKDYLQWRNVRTILFLDCGSPDWHELQNIKPNLKLNDIWLNHWDMSREANLSHFNYKHFFDRSSYSLCVIVNWECNKTTSMLREISKRTMFHFERYWLIFGKSSENIFHILSSENINVDAEVAIVLRIAKNQYDINEVYNPSSKRNGRLRMGKIGNWTDVGGLKMNETESKFKKRHNLGGLTFLSAITIPKLPPNKTLFEHINSNELLFMDSQSKSNYRVIKILMEMYNFKIILRQSKIWGNVKADGSWTGAIGLLNRSEIDVSVTGLRWENDRYGAYESTTDAFYLDVMFIFRHPTTVDALSVFLLPFDWVVWLTIISITFITSAFITYCFQVEKLSNMEKSRCKESTENESSYFNSFLMIVQILFQQGYERAPLFMSSRILVITLLMYSLVIYQFYSAYIVGSLFTESPKTINTMKQLLHSKLDLATDEFPYVVDIFNHSREESAVKMYKKIMAQPNPFIPLFTALNLIKQGSLAYNTDGIYAYAILKNILTDSEVCDLQEVKYVPKYPTGPGVPYKSPLKELIKIGIRKLRETGILAHVWKTWIARIPKCARSGVRIVPVDMVHFSSALYALGLGIHISVAVLIIELCVMYCLKVRNMFQLN